MVIMSCTLIKPYKSRQVCKTANQTKEGYIYSKLQHRLEDRNFGFSGELSL